nr:hypothetical protein Q903MT_gene4957 [Picea sitchensis]
MHMMLLYMHFRTGYFKCQGGLALLFKLFILHQQHFNPGREGSRLPVGLEPLSLTLPRLSSMTDSLPPQTPQRSFHLRPTLLLSISCRLLIPPYLPLI